MKTFKRLLLVGVVLLIVGISIEVLENRMGYDILTDFDISQTSQDSIVLDVPIISQEGYPTGCESATTVMALRYQGYDIDLDTFIDDYLPKSELTYQDGELFGKHPNESFIGDPRRDDSFGCYAPVIVQSVKSILSEDNPNGLEVKNLTGQGLRKICKEYVSNGVPVIVWTTIDMQPSEQGKTWTLLNTDGKTFTWTSKEHCMLLVGYDDDHYYFNDPLNPSENAISYDRTLVEKRYRELGCQAVVII